MGREEWLLAEAIEQELQLAYDALTKVDVKELSGSVLDPDDEWSDAEYEILAWHLEKSLRSIAVLAERLGTPSIEREIAKLRKRNLGVTSRPYDGEIHSEIYSLANACFAPLKAMTDAHAVTAHTVLQNIVKNTAQIVQMRGISPTNEADVRNAVLDVCRFAFPDAIKEVGIPQLLTSSRADIGVASLRTVIEFKFVTEKNDMANALKGVYSDMKTYRSTDWDNFYGVFYMTKPFFNDEDVRREFTRVRADLSWTPFSISGFGGRLTKAEKAEAKVATKSAKAPK
ncbi:hypothetical protein [Acidovorax sp. Leaf73]|uniref:PD-(D/E)XK nuclease domain-containing protein n=1 Tax=Acidovorax sp. Leaf73 TaxID=2876566 RepID=UPI001E3098F3|nr:hypothetical protein [Acidovorax sp. Leaf73]